VITTLIILAVFWKPILWAGQAAYAYSRDKAMTTDNVNPSYVNAAYYMGQIKAWFVKLWELIGPGSWGPRS